MLNSLATIALTVGAGAALALAPRNGGLTLGSVRSFALTAAVGIVLVHFLPHALEGLGLVALLLVAAGVVVPHLLERGVAHAVTRAKSRLHLGLEASFAGLVAHSVGDGFALAGAETQGLVVLLSIGAHTVPVVAFVVLTFQASEGRRGGLRRAGWLALATTAGVLSYQLLSPAWLERYEPAFDAVVAGLLLHVVAHELGHALPTSTSSRIADSLAGAAGLALVVVSSWLGEDAAHHAREGLDGGADFGSNLGAFALSTAPAIVAAILMGAATTAVVESRFPGQLRRWTWLRIACGIPDPWEPEEREPHGVTLGSTPCLPADSPAQSLILRGLAPVLTVEGLTLSALLLGLPFTLLLACTALAAAALAAVLLRSRVTTPETATAPVSAVVAKARRSRVATHSTSLVRRFLHTLDGRGHRMGAGVLLGLVVGAQIQTFVVSQVAPSPAGGPPSLWGSLLGMGPAGVGLLEIAVLIVVALPARSGLMSAILVASALATQGVGTGILGTALLLAAWANPALLRGLRQWAEPWAFWLLLALIAASSSLFAVLASHLSAPPITEWRLTPWPQAWPALPQGLLPLALAQPTLALAALALVALLLRGVWQSGVTGWLAATFELRTAEEASAEAPSCSCPHHHSH